MKKLVNGKGGKGIKAQRSMTKTQNRQADALDELMIYEEFKNSFLPQLREMIRQGISPEKIRKAFAPVVQASMIQKALKGDYKAMKDVLDRHEGMAVQRVEQKTIHAKMGQEELAALVAQKMKDTGMDKVLEAKFKTIKDNDDTEQA